MIYNVKNNFNNIFDKDEKLILAIYGSPRKMVTLKN